MRRLVETSQHLTDETVQPPIHLTPQTTEHAMKLLATLRSLLAPAGAPLVVLGPGGDFTEHVFERAGRLTVERPACHTMQEIETDADPFSAQDEHITARSRRHRLSRFLSESAEEIAVLDVSPRTAPVITLNENESNESHTQAAAHLRIHPSAPRTQGLLTNDAGDRRLTRRHQGDGVRTRRSAHQEGRAGARSEQESLFVDR